MKKAEKERKKKEAALTAKINAAVKKKNKGKIKPSNNFILFIIIRNINENICR